MEEDCILYDNGSLRIVDKGENGWRLTDGRSSMKILDDEGDAKAALALARRHTRQCFIGRGNARPNRKSYIVQYWSGDSGISTTIEREDCVPYDATSLRIMDMGANGWRLTDQIC